MARDETPPFARGETFYNGVAKESIYLDPLNYLGKEYVFEVNQQQQSYPGTTDTSGRLIRVRVAQNSSSIPLLPKRIARYDLTPGIPLGTKVDGYTFQVSDFPAGVIDEFLPPAGVAVGDFFYLVVEGPTVVKSAPSGTIALVPGDKVQIKPGTSATNADAGFVVELGVSPTLADEFNRIGRADATVATTSTDTAAVVNFSHLR